MSVITKILTLVYIISSFGSHAGGARASDEQDSGWGDGMTAGRPSAPGDGGKALRGLFTSGLGTSTKGGSFFDQYLQKIVAGVQDNVLRAPVADMRAGDITDEGVRLRGNKLPLGAYGYDPYRAGQSPDPTQIRSGQSDACTSLEETWLRLCSAPHPSFLQVQITSSEEPSSPAASASAMAAETEKGPGRGTDMARAGHGSDTAKSETSGAPPRRRRLIRDQFPASAAHQIMREAANDVLAKQQKVEERRTTNEEKNQLLKVAQEQEAHREGNPGGDNDDNRPLHLHRDNGRLREVKAVTPLSFLETATASYSQPTIQFGGDGGENQGDYISEGRISQMSSSGRSAIATVKAARPRTQAIGMPTQVHQVHPPMRVPPTHMGPFLPTDNGRDRKTKNHGEEWESSGSRLSAFPQLLTSTQPYPPPTAAGTASTSSSQPSLLARAAHYLSASPGANSLSQPPMSSSASSSAMLPPTVRGGSTKPSDPFLSMDVVTKMLFPFAPGAIIPDYLKALRKHGTSRLRDQASNLKDEAALATVRLRGLKGGLMGTMSPAMGLNYPVLMAPPSRGPDYYDPSGPLGPDLPLATSQEERCTTMMNTWIYKCLTPM